MKRLMAVFFIILIFFLTAFSLVGHAADEQAMEPNPVEYVLDAQIRNKDIINIEDSIKENMHEDIDEILPEFDPESIIKDMATGKITWDIKEIPARLLNYFTKEIKIQLSVLIKLIAVAFLFSLLKNLQESFMNESIGELTFFACYTAMVALIAVSFKQVLSLAAGIIDNIDQFINMAVPALIALLVSSGNIVSGSTLQPLLIFGLQATCRLLKDVILPLVFFSSVLFIVDGISERIKISKLATLMRQIALWSLGIILTVYVSLITLQGISSAVVDGVTTKATKFALSTFIPVAGKYLADAADTVIGCALIVKNAAGIATMIGLLAIAIIPIIKILSILVMYRIAGVIIEPVVEERISDCLSEISECMTVVLGIVAAALFMFLLAVAAVIGAGSVSAMMQ